MTAPDPRLGEIEARLSKATPGPWEHYVSGACCEGECIEGRGGSVQHGMDYITWPDAEFIAAAPADVAYLLAELRKAQDALGRVEGLAARWATLADGDRYYARHIRAALDEEKRP